MIDVILKKGKEKSLLRRHPWVYDTAIQKVLGAACSGETVRVVSADGRPLGLGAYSPASTLRVRMWTFDASVDVDDPLFLRRRIEAAVEAREALLTRIAKGKGFPEISPVVDIGNAVSLKYDIPIGAHDMGTVERALEVRPAREGDTFVPFGGGEAEVPEPGEVVYVSNGQVRTRRWTWRLREIGSLTEQTRDLLFPLDGFRSVNYERTLAARADLARYLETLFGAKTAVGLVDKDNPVFEADI